MQEGPEIVALASPDQLRDTFARLMGVDESLLVYPIAFSSSRPPPISEVYPYVFDDPPTRVHEDRDDSYVDAAAFSRSKPPPPPWSIAFADDFIKTTKQLDTKLMGRVLGCLSELSRMAYPFSIRGDTLKPLQKELKGAWRYRLGDHRLVFKPLPDVATLQALTLAARGSVYD